MATTIATQPGNLTPVLNQVRFELTMSDGGTAPIEKSLLYQLELTDGTDVTGEEVIPYRTGNYLLDFAEDLEEHVFTTKL